MSPQNGNFSNPDFRLLSINPPLLISSPPFLSFPPSSPLFSPLCMRVHVVLKDSDRGAVGGAHGLMINHEEGKKQDIFSRILNIKLINFAVG